MVVSKMIVVAWTESFTPPLGSPLTLADGPIILPGNVSEDEVGLSSEPGVLVVELPVGGVPVVELYVDGAPMVVVPLELQKSYSYKHT